ncbi:MAG TPA: response regulator [Thiobacillaceae bacterium]|nr:response regulator [Thiobacillaceae bacterium]HNU63586.1 response regulator [Thiobacillaceae bacterium]
MSLTLVKGSGTAIDFEALQALIVDTYPGMRNALKLTLSNLGVSRIDLATNAAEALSRVRNHRYDLILSDFNLGEGQDGQQLLEALRHRKLISLRTAFVLVTAEAGYEKVVATAELAPDDYLVKPFSAELIRSRLQGILLRKFIFSKVHWHFERHELEAAVAGCDEIIRQNPRFLVDALRFKGEVLNALGRFDEAETLYRKIIEMRAIPWARLGLAKALHNLQKDEEAEVLLQGILEHFPEMVAAYDLLADVCMARKDLAGAQMALQQGAAISAKTVRRQQRLGETAFENGDLAVARVAYGTVVEKGGNSIFVTPEDYGHLARIQIEQGDANGALETVQKFGTLLLGSPEGRLVSAVVRGLAHARLGHVDEASKAVEEAADLSRTGVRAGGHFMLDFVAACLATGHQEQADAITREVVRNAHDSEALLARAQALYDKAGCGADGARLVKDAAAGIRRLDNEAVIQAHKGNYARAMEMLQEACWQAPGNPRVLMNTVWVMLKHLEQAGMDTEILEQARAFLRDADQQAPGHARLASLRAQLRAVEVRYGRNR